MLGRMLSADFPRSRPLAAILLIALFALALAPFLFPGSQPLNVAAKICVFVLLAASYDLLLGYTGIVSFAHTMVFGIGGYGIAIGATLMIVAENYLQALLGRRGEAAAGVPVVSSLLSADRWLFWLGILFVLSVYFFPTGIVGRLRARAQARVTQRSDRPGRS